MENISENLKGLLNKYIEGLELAIFLDKKIGNNSLLKDLVKRTFKALHQIITFGRGYSIFVAERCIIILKEAKSESLINELEVLLKICCVLQLTYKQAETVEDYERLYLMEKVCVFLANNSKCINPYDIDFEHCFLVKHDEHSYPCFLYILKLANNLLKVKPSSKTPADIKSICKSYSNKLKLDEVIKSISQVNDVEIEKFFSQDKNKPYIFLERNTCKKTIDQIINDFEELLSSENNSLNKISNTNSIKNELQKENYNLTSSNFNSEQKTMLPNLNYEFKNLDDLKNFIVDFTFKYNTNVQILEKKIQVNEEKHDNDIEKLKSEIFSLKSKNEELENKLARCETINDYFILKECIGRIFKKLFSLAKISEKSTIDDLITKLVNLDLLSVENKPSLLKALYRLIDIKNDKNCLLVFENDKVNFNFISVIKNLKNHLDLEEYNILEKTIVKDIK